MGQVDGAMPTVMAQGATAASRSTGVFAPIPRSLWQSTPDVAAPALPEDSPLDSLVVRLSSPATTSSQAQSSQTNDLLDILSDDGERVPWTETGVTSTLLVGTGILTGSGYVLLNSRLGLWLLGLLTARPLWRQFDPLEVLYAWEEDGRVRTLDDDEDEETLISLLN